MREQPAATELLEAIARFLREEAAPALSGRMAFHARVAANALEIVGREITLGPAAAAAEAERLQSLLRHAGEPDALNAELCARLHAGDIDPADPALLHHLWQTTLDTVAIDQPRYATYRHIIAAGAQG